jgi:ectoine hydroxylase-related dioxygenase (phytanoyl-CoA dioxygenase family)
MAAMAENLMDMYLHFGHKPVIQFLLQRSCMSVHHTTSSQPRAQAPVAGSKHQTYQAYTTSRYKCIECWGFSAHIGKETALVVIPRCNGSEC